MSIIHIDSIIGTRATDRSATTARAVRLAGMWLVAKLREQARVSGAYQAARNARKMGLPLSHALLIIARRQA